MNIVMPLLALAGLGAFLAVLIFHVSTPDLVIVVLLTFAFAAFDLYRSGGGNGRK